MTGAPGRVVPPIVLLLAAAALAAGVVAWYVYFRPQVPEPVAEVDEPVLDPPTPDPRLTFPTRFRNVRPEVRYVGDATCASCHGRISKQYHAHPMGRSAEFVARATPIEKYDAAARASFRAGPYELRVEQTADGMVHRVGARDATGAPLPEYVFTPDIAIGSGTRGRSYLSVEHGAVWQSPVSWFTPEARWDVSPGFDLGNGGRRAIIPECLFCHVNRVEPVPRAMNRYREPLLGNQAAIGCERCHGPGELHVAERRGGLPPEPVDDSIVNPRHLPLALQASVCEQCHLQGEQRVARRGRDVYEFRPGLPFEQFVTVFVRPPELAEVHKSVGQFEQLEQSRCTTPGGGRLSCTACHDPHTTPAAADRDAFYRTRCLTCHESQGCSLPVPQRAAKNDSCIACHMPVTGSASIVHASVTDHRIVRRPGPPAPARAMRPGEIPLVAFRSGPYSPPPAERERDLGIALARAALKLPPGPGGLRGVVGGLARDRLTASLGNWRGDPDAWLALSFARLACRDVPGRLEAAMTAARLVPDSENALETLWEAAFQADRNDVALDAASRLIAMNPTAVEPLLGRAAILIEQGEWAKAEADCRAALRIQPVHPQGHIQLAVCLHRRGNPDAARNEAQTALGLTTRPDERAAFLEWYQRHTR